MTYQVLKLVFDWAKNAANHDKFGKEYQKALAELAVAIKRVMRFNQQGLTRKPCPSRKHRWRPIPIYAFFTLLFRI